MLVYGRNVAEEFLKKNEKVRKVYLQTGFHDENLIFLIGKFKIPTVFREKKELDQLAKGRNDFQVLLAHNPVFFDAYAGWGADLTLCGHFHGGTIRIPGLGGVMTPQYQFFLPWCAGRFDADGKTMIVSRGLRVPR